MSQPPIGLLDRRQFVSGAALASLAVSTSAWQGASPGVEAAFPALRQQINGHPLAYLDSAATTLRPRAVIDAIAEFYATANANPSPVHTLARRAGERLTAARQAVARFVNAAAPDEIIFTRGTTEGINLVAETWGRANVRAGDEVMLTVAEHNSNLLPWTRVAERAGARLRIIDVDEDGRLRMDQFKEMLSARTRVVAFSHVSNVLGLINPAKEICALARQAGARVVIDGAQGAPHTPIDVKDLQCDFYVFSSHKLLGPMGCGVVWGRRELLEEMPPYQVGSNMAHDADFARASYEHGALKYQAGTPDVAGPVGLAAALEFLNAKGAGALWQHDQALVNHGLQRLAQIPSLRLIGPRTVDHRVPVFTFRLGDRPAAAVARALDARGIAVRAGDMAALPLLRRFGVSEAVRASAYLYSTTGDLDRLAEALQQVLKG
ncbi:MAG TPA: aminotransferase class V-fold PLP-dependent enzyme [Vicinamibacterales bacterium]|nr:aminotransferase class V-fold PLP-dependent enzyme [Vicinamibacterales bacterium]